MKKLLQIILSFLVCSTCYAGGATFNYTVGSINYTTDVPVTVCGVLDQAVPEFQNEINGVRYYNGDALLKTGAVVHCSYQYYYYGLYDSNQIEILTPNSIVCDDSSETYQDESNSCESDNTSIPDTCPTGEYLSPTSGCQLIQSCAITGYIFDTLLEECVYRCPHYEAWNVHEERCQPSGAACPAGNVLIDEDCEATVICDVHESWLSASNTCTDKCIPPVYWSNENQNCMSEPQGDPTDNSNPATSGDITALRNLVLSANNNRAAFSEQQLEKLDIIAAAIASSNSGSGTGNSSSASTDAILSDILSSSNQTNSLLTGSGISDLPKDYFTERIGDSGGDSYLETFDEDTFLDSTDRIAGNLLSSFLPQPTNTCGTLSATVPHYGLLVFPSASQCQALGYLKLLINYLFASLTIVYLYYMSISIPRG